MEKEESSALVIPVPDVEPLVKRWRETLDPGCILGVPAHITVLFPFASPNDIDAEVVSTLERFFSEFDPMELVFDSVGWFGDTVAFLGPNPDTVLRRITRGLVRLFPTYPPYGGKHGEPTPHLTIGDGAPRNLLEEAARTVALHLPCRAFVDRVWLMAGTDDPGSWTLRNEFALGRRSRQSERRRNDPGS
jgi:2'-5' RNA ligase